MNNALSWFEIPVTDMDRAIAFYSTILQIGLQMQEIMGTQMALFPYSSEGVGGSLTKGEDYTPGDTGTVVYLNAGAEMNSVLDRVEKAGGEVVQFKTPIGPFGFIAYFMDTEGNRVGLHSKS